MNWCEFPRVYLIFIHIGLQVGSPPDHPTSWPDVPHSPPRSAWAMLGHAGPTDQATNQAKHIEKNNSSWLTTQFCCGLWWFFRQIDECGKIGYRICFFWVHAGPIRWSIKVRICLWVCQILFTFLHGMWWFDVFSADGNSSWSEKTHRRSRWFLEVSESQKKNIHGISWDHHSKDYLAKNQPEPAAKIAKAFMGMSFRGLVWVEPFANLPSSLWGQNPEPAWGLCREQDVGMGQNLQHFLRFYHPCGWIGMNIHLPPALISVFTRMLGFDTQPHFSSQAQINEKNWKDVVTSSYSWIRFSKFCPSQK